MIFTVESARGDLSRYEKVFARYHSRPSERKIGAQDVTLRNLEALMAFIAELGELNDFWDDTNAGVVINSDDYMTIYDGFLE